MSLSYLVATALSGQLQKPIGGGQWTESVVHPFEGPPDGGFSYNGMVVGRFGNFYGATVHGGTDDDGCVYKFTP